MMNAFILKLHNACIIATHKYLLLVFICHISYAALTISNIRYLVV